MHYCFVFISSLLITVQSFIINSSLQSPCPNIFQYKTRYDFYQYGLLSVPSPPINRDSVLLIASFVLRGRLPTQYGGLLELQRSRSETIQDILHQNPITFIIHFPLQDPLPRLVFVSLENRVICGQSDSPMLRRQVLHKIEFRYKFNTIGLETDNSLAFPIDNAIQEVGYDEHQPSIAVKNPETFELTRKCGILHDKFASTPLVAGGSSIERGSWPWLVAIYKIKSSGPLFRCAGTLMSERLVLTAASCFSDDNREISASEILVTVGKFNLSNWLERDAETTPIMSINKHPKYQTESADFDIAMLIMSSNVSFNQFVEPICLSTNTDEPADPIGIFGTVVGWGASSSDTDHPLAIIPESVTISVVSKHLCRHESQQLGNQSQPNNESNFCAGNRNAVTTFNSCYGDLGSGFVILRDNRLALRGIVTRNQGEMHCKSSQYLMLTDVAKHTDWLRQFI